jgi:predicted nicotinamide N-methyase
LFFKEKKSTSSSTFVRSLTVTLSDGTPTTVSVAQRHTGEEGVVVWDAALVLAHFLVRHQDRFRLGEGVHVLELGAGTGIVGVVAAALG